MDEIENARRSKMPDRLRACGWAELDIDGYGFDVGPSSPDGAYFTYKADTDHFCLVVIGRMAETPYELNRRIGGMYRVCGLWVLYPCRGMDVGRRQVLMERGLYRIDFEPWELTERRLNGETLPRTIPPPSPPDELRDELLAALKKIDELEERLNDLDDEERWEWLR